MPDPFTIKHVDEFEVMEGSGGATWRLARKSLGEEAFGFNVVDIEPGGELPAHDEAASGQDEVFVILDGEATFVAGNKEHPAPAGTFARCGPELHRTVRNHSGGTVRAMIIGVPAASGYEKNSWA